MIISISGNKGAGKDYAGRIIQILSLFPKMETNTVVKNINKKFSNNIFEIKKWAESPNKMFKFVTGIDYSNLDREDKELYRPLFIDFADNHMKKCFGEDVWVKHLINQYKPTKRDNNIYSKRELTNFSPFDGEMKFYPNWIITDTRLPLEFECLNESPQIDVLFIRIFGKDDNLAGDHLTETFINEVYYQEYVYNTKQDPHELVDILRYILIKHEII